MKYAVINVNGGNGPYCRNIEIVLSLNQRLLAAGREPLGIVIPDLYGEKQIAIIEEEFGPEVGDHPEWFVLDEDYGGLLSEILYSGVGYGAYLERLAREDR